MHDAVTGERMGVPSVSIMTDRFISAAELMATVLGAADHRFAIVPHPISSASAEGLADAARRAAAECIRLLMGGTANEH